MRRKKTKNKNPIIMISIICFLLIMTTGYAAFSTNLTLTAKGNVKKINAAWQLKQNLVTVGDGLYNDESNDGRYVYRGLEPNNYINFNGKLWRIISIEQGSELKIIAEIGVKEMSFDIENHRLIENNSFCNNKEYGCPIWSKIEGDFTTGYMTGTVTENSSIMIYLNNDYYNSMDSTTQSFIKDYTFNIGSVEHNIGGISKIISSEEKYKWTGKIGLINPSDFYNSSSNLGCRQASGNSSWLDQTLCKDNTFLLSVSSSYWSINSQSYNNGITYAGLINHKNYFGWTHAPDSYAVRPVIFLKSDISLLGSGTKSDPYTIK